MAPSSARAPRADRRVSDQLSFNEFFSRQRTPSADLPEPEPLLRNLTIGVLEVLAGVREPEQLGRWLTEDAFAKLVTRANLSARARSARSLPASRPQHRILTVRFDAPADSVVEGVIVVAGPTRTRAVAIRLEGWDARWRATSLALL